MNYELCSQQSASKNFSLLVFGFFLISFLLSSLVGFSQRTEIPDANFRRILSSRYNITADSNNTILNSAAVAVDSLDVSSRNIHLRYISNLTGIEAFTALTSLICYSHQLTSLDVSANTALTTLDCRYNQLTSLDVSANTALTWLDCGGNQLTSLDVSANTALTTLYCYSNLLTSLDVSANMALTTLYCYSNQLTSLDVSTNLTSLSCFSNQLTSLDVSANTALTTLYCYSNLLTSLDVSGATALTSLNCQTNQLTSLDVSANEYLTTLWCHNNQLTELNVKNGNNRLITEFYAIGNPNLVCIQVDNVAYSTANWLWGGKDATASYSENCSAPTIMVVTVDTTSQIITMQTNGPVILTNVDNEDFIVTSTLNGVTTTHRVNSISIGSIILNVTPPIPTGATVSISYDPTQGSNTDVITDNDGNPMSSFTDITNTLSNKDFELSRVSISPNPTAGILNISVDEKAEYKLLNIRGQILKTGVLDVGKSKIDISSFARGLYLLNIKTSKGSFIEKIIKK